MSMSTYIIYIYIYIYMHKCRSSASAGDGSEFWKNSVTCIRCVVLHARMCTHMLPAYSRTNYEAIHIH